MNPYYWELEFDCVKINELEQKRLPSERRIDPQDPPAELGPARFVRLIPQDESFPPVTIVVPLNAKPVCHRLIIQASDGLSGYVCQRIGWKVENIRSIISINLKTKEVVGLLSKD